MGKGKPAGIRAARKLRTDRRNNRWANKKYTKSHSKTAMKANPLGGASMAKGIVLEKIGIEAKFNHILSGQEHKDYFATKGAVYNALIGSNYKPENGSNITLTIDINIQTILQD